jgi:hypothetical protein
MDTSHRYDELYAANAPASFWKLILDKPPTEEEWLQGMKKAASVLPETVFAGGAGLTEVLAQTLGEVQFGPDHWRLSQSKRLYYVLKPMLPHKARQLLRQLNRLSVENRHLLRWPVEDRYVMFQWAVVRHVLGGRGQADGRFLHFWPHGCRFAFVLTHDVEGAKGQQHVRRVADHEERLGFRSSFNFVPESYRVDWALLDELRSRGFEIGVHGLKHDGKLFRSKKEFTERARAINRYLREFDAVGYRSPLTQRQPEWMQALEVTYDLSFFDTDPYEPIGGGTMCIWPFFLGRFVELPYTLAQDSTVVDLLGERTPRIWLEKIRFIARFCGMALVNTHPDYLSSSATASVYGSFLETVKSLGGFWHALPRQVAEWWRSRAAAQSVDSLPGGTVSTLRICEDDVIVQGQESG